MSTGSDARYGLANLAQTCHLAPRGRWEEVIEDHFQLMLAAIPGLEIVDAIPTVARVLAEQYANGPGSISPHLYCVRDSESMLRIPLEVTGQDVQTYAPDEFVELLNRLAEA